MDTRQAAELMKEFAARTGLTSSQPARRYLWTDAFAVCNFLGLARATDDARYLELAEQLVDQVHHTLGRHRDDNERTGWLSGLSDEQAEAHPTAGGLRIGKPLPERDPDEAMNQRLEWERDGQYFHYLTKWMHALDLMAGATDRPHYNLWARELARAAIGAFTYTPPGGGRPRMYWKMSVDLSRPQVASMGHHDPLDGFVTCKQLQAGASRWPDAPREPRLSDEIDILEEMIEGRDWTTTDPLGLGGILMDAQRLHRLVEAGDADGRARLVDVLDDVLDAAGRGLARYAATQPLGQSAGRRLAFRELGLAIGLYAVDSMATSVGEERLARFEPYLALRGDIVGFWQEPQHREVPSWQDHQDINDVMLATAEMPEGCML